MKDMAIEIISGRISEYIRTPPDGVVGLVDCCDLEELKASLFETKASVGLVLVGRDDHALSGLDGATVVCKLRLALEAEHDIYVIDNTESDLDSWAAHEAFRITNNAKVIYILDDVGEKQQPTYLGD